VLVNIEQSPTQAIVALPPDTVMPVPDGDVDADVITYPAAWVGKPGKKVCK